MSLNRKVMVPVGGTIMGGKCVTNGALLNSLLVSGYV
jgi:hypothetical protein